MISDEALILVLVATGFLVMFRVISGHTAAAIIGSVLLYAVLGPFIDSLLDLLPGWALILLMIAFGITLFQAVASLFIGKSVSNHMTGILAADIIRFFIFLPFRIAGAIIGAVFGRRTNYRR